MILCVAPRFCAGEASSRGVFFSNATAPTEVYTLSLHDALPICRGVGSRRSADLFVEAHRAGMVRGCVGRRVRSEEHTSELQSRGHLVCRLLLEKKKHDR